MRRSLISLSRIRLKVILKTALSIPGLALRPRRPALRVLFYHRVNPFPFEQLGPVSRELTVTPEEFAWQLEYLASTGHRSLGLDELHAMLCGRTAIDPKAVLITFDDGYEDNLVFAAPLLQRFGFTAVVFVVSGFVGAETATVWPMSDPPGLGRFLSEDQLRAWQGLGFEIGSHTVDHPVLTALTRASRQAQLAESRQRLEAVLKSPVTAFAYPGGDFDADVEADVKQAGYRVAFTTAPGTNPVGAAVTALNRTEVSASDSRFVFRMKVAGALDWLWFKESAATRAILRRVNQMLAPLARSAG